MRVVRLTGQLRNELTGESSRVEFIGTEQEVELPFSQVLSSAVDPEFDPLSDPLDDPFPEE